MSRIPTSWFKRLLFRQTVSQRNFRNNIVSFHALLSLMGESWPLVVLASMNMICIWLISDYSCANSYGAFLMCCGFSMNLLLMKLKIFFKDSWKVLLKETFLSLLHFHLGWSFSSFDVSKVCLFPFWRNFIWGWDGAIKFMVNDEGSDGKGVFSFIFFNRCRK